MLLELHATIFAAKKQLSEAKALFAQAAYEEKKLVYREPPAYIRSVGETEGAVLLRAGDGQARFSLYGLAQASEAKGNAQTGREEYAKFLAAGRTAMRAGRSSRMLVRIWLKRRRWSRVQRHR
jgi:hypothetical protein